MHVGHNGYPVGPGQVGDRPDLALCRMVNVDEWRPDAGGRASAGEGFGQAEGMMHDKDSLMWERHDWCARHR